MRSVRIRDNGKVVGILLRSSKGDLLKKEKLQMLLPLVRHVIDKTDNLLLIKPCENITIDDGRLVIKDCCMLKDIVKILHDNLSEKIIVPQVMDQGPDIRHRPLYFGLSEDLDSIEVRYTTLGDSNSIDVALDYLTKLYTTPEQLTL